MKRRLFLLLLTLFTYNLLLAQDFSAEQIKTFVDGNLREFPQSTLQDLYKSFFQSVYGPEHLVTDSAKVVAYMDVELRQDFNDEYPLVQFVGITGNFVRVNLSAVKKGYVPKGLLASCFIRSSQYKSDVGIDDFRKQWRKVVRYIADNGIQLDNFSHDSLYVENLLAKGKYVWVHSPQYKAAYKPHYRIVERSIFEKEIKPLLIKISNIRTQPLKGRIE